MWAYILMIGIAGMTVQTIKKSIRYEMIEKKRRKKEIQDWLEKQFFKKLEQNRLVYKLISNPNLGYNIYETRYCGYRFLITEKKNELECWAEHKNKVLFQIKRKKRNDEWEMHFPINVNRALYPNYADKLKKVIENEEWKENVRRAAGKHYPMMKKVLKMAKKTDEEIYVKLKSFESQFVHLYIHKDKMEEQEVKKWLEIIPEKIESMIKAFRDLHPTYQKKGKKEFLQTLDEILKKYPFIHKEKDSVFLMLKE